MDISSAGSAITGMQNQAMAQQKDVALLKKGMDHEAQMASQIIDAIPKVDHQAPPGQQVNMTA